LAPAATIAFNILSSILIPPEKVRLFRDRDTGMIAVSANQDFDHVGDAAMLTRGRFAHSFLDGRIDAQIERGDFGFRHAVHCIQNVL